MTVPADVLAARVARVRAHLAHDGLDALLITHLPNLHYLTGFRASAGAAILTGDRLYLLADFRYRTAATVAAEALSRLAGAVYLPVPRAFDEVVVETLRSSGARRVGLEAAHLPLKRFDWLARALPAMAPATASDARTELVSTERVVERERAVKDSFEIRVLREAGSRLAELVEPVIGFVRARRREREIAADIDYAVRKAGFERPAFETIVASGPNSALPHARPGDRRLESGDPVVLDFGGVYDGYCVDLTRTVSVGEPTEELVRLYQAVLEAQAAARSAIRPGVPARSIDRAAREVLERLGLAEAFGHGTGHGLGLEVHEEPRVGQPVAGQADTVIEPGMVFTLEPGVYVPGIGGVRIEDDVLVTADGCEMLTDAPRTLIIT
jgi:Xaa-Pro aminopeptidase